MESSPLRLLLFMHQTKNISLSHPTETGKQEVRNQMGAGCCTFLADEQARAIFESSQSLFVSFKTFFL